MADAEASKPPLKFGVLFDAARALVAPERQEQLIEDWRSFALCYARVGLDPMAVAQQADVLVLQMVMRERRLHEPLPDAATDAAAASVESAQPPDGVPNAG